MLEVKKQLKTLMKPSHKNLVVENAHVEELCTIYLNAWLLSYIVLQKEFCFITRKMDIMAMLEAVIFNNIPDQN